MIPDHARGLIFDCDGTLADTMPAHYRAWSAALAPTGLDFPEARFYAMGGMPSKAIIAWLAAEQGIAVDVDHFAKMKEAAFLEQIAAVRPIAAVVELARAQVGARPMAVASGGYRRVVERVLRHLEIDGWFAATVCAEDTARHKPEPDVFLEAARRLNVEPGGCVVFEDTDIGLEAARRAGMVGIDVRPLY